MKRLRYVRHGDKKGDIIGQEGLDRAQREAPIGAYTDVFHGPLLRTAQTLLAVVGSLGCKVRVHEPIEEIGTDELFKEIVTPEFREVVSSGLSNLEAADKVHPAMKINQWTSNAAVAVAKMFEAMPEGGLALAYGHDPIISMVARFLGLERVRSLKTLEYIDFLEKEGRISVVGIGPTPK